MAFVLLVSSRFTSLSSSRTFPLRKLVLFRGGYTSGVLSSILPHSSSHANGNYFDDDTIAQMVVDRSACKFAFDHGSHVDMYPEDLTCYGRVPMPVVCDTQLAVSSMEKMAKKLTEK